MDHYNNSLHNNERYLSRNIERDGLDTFGSSFLLLASRMEFCILLHNLHNGWISQELITYTMDSIPYHNDESLCRRRRRVKECIHRDVGSSDA